MIVVNRNWLINLGMPSEVALALEDGDGLMFSHLDSFAAGMTGARYTSALVREPAPRTLLLLGLHDRPGAGEGLASIIEIGLDGGTLRRPRKSERETILDMLALVDHWSARAIGAALHAAAQGEAA